MSLEQRVWIFLLDQERSDLRRYLPFLKKLEWEERHQPFMTVLENYLKDTEDGYTFKDLAISEYPHKGYLGTLLGEQRIPDPVGRKELKRLINHQVENQLAAKLETLKGKPRSEQLRILKDLKAPLPDKAKTLAQLRLQRLDDRELEKVAPSTGYSELDAIIRGFVPGRVYLMSGETNVGKTMTACNFAFNVAKQGKRVLYFSLEPGATLVEYLASIWSNRPFSELTPELLNPPEGIVIDVYLKDDVASLDAMIQIVEDSERYDLIIIDHLGYFTTDGNNKTQQESNAMKLLNSLAKRKQCAMMLIAHLRKPSSTTKKQPITMNEISGSASFKQDATEVLLLVRQSDETDEFGIKYADTGFILVHKTKAGQGGGVPIQFLSNSGRIIQKKDMIGEHIYETR